MNESGLEKAKESSLREHRRHRRLCINYKNISQKHRTYCFATSWMGNRLTSCTICLDISISDGTGTLGCSSGYPNAFTVVIVRMVNPGFNEWRMKRRYGAAGSRSIDTIFDINASSHL